MKNQATTASSFGRKGGGGINIGRGNRDRNLTYDEVTISFIRKYLPSF